jgi:hypothetical protein
VSPAADTLLANGIKKQHTNKTQIKPNFVIFSIDYLLFYRVYKKVISDGGKGI